MGTVSPVILEALDVDERKRLGQFFTGLPLARLLAELAEASNARTVLDPMVGSGDMLEAVRSGDTNQLLAGIEIDPIAGAYCASRLGADGAAAHIAIGNAFSPKTWASLPGQAWDLVITNPPYVRYQRGAFPTHGRVDVPSAAEVRHGLLQVLGLFKHLSKDEHQVWRSITKAYSGLGDLAVPAWILCAGLVAIEGRLAMVVPDTWLSRDYSLPVLYLLQRYFEIEVVVEDGQAGWFEDALVRTTLLVARRVPDRGSAFRKLDTGHVHVRLEESASDLGSLVGALQHDTPFPERAFASAIRLARVNRASLQSGGLQAEWVRGNYFSDLLASQSAGSRWLVQLEPNGTPTSPSSVPHLSRQAEKLIGTETTTSCRTLSSFGWSVGQGLRTGANRFFYGSCLHQSDDHVVFSPNPIFGQEPFRVPVDAVLPVLRKQQDVRAGGAIRGRVLDLRNFVLPEDAAEIKAALNISPYREMPGPLADFVRIVARANIGSPEEPKFVPSLSAVATNARPHDRRRPDRLPRFWYQIPPLQPRHVPELFIPRVNYRTPKASLNKTRAVVDANFSTLWRVKPDALPLCALLALLSSTWVGVSLETSAPVLGGGALKVEAAHLRRLPLPQLTGKAGSELEMLGHELVKGGSAEHEVVSEIDHLVWSALASSDVHSLMRSGSHALSELVARRSGPASRKVDGS